MYSIVIPNCFVLGSINYQNKQQIYFILFFAELFGGETKLNPCFQFGINQNKKSPNFALIILLHDLFNAGKNVVLSSIF